MRKTWSSGLGIVALVGLLLAFPAMAPAATFLGSVTITCTPSPCAAGAIVGFAVTANPGLEKTITQPLPPFAGAVTVPVITDSDEDSTGGGPRILRRNLDTVLVLTNTTGSGLTVQLTVRDADGGDPPVGTGSVLIPAGGTRAVLLSTLVP